MTAFAKWTENLAQAWNASSSQGRRGRNSMTDRAEMIRGAIASYKQLAAENSSLREENAELKRRCHVLEYGTPPSGFAD
ncbi:MAG TPA: hypothetical protein VKD00_06910 [Methyloceanibacter sp.]|nr:hypothetical protein [Methyloceanibacter sp.]